MCKFKTPLSCGIYRTLYCNNEYQDQISLQIINNCGCNLRSIVASYGNKIDLNNSCNIKELKMSGYEMLLLGMRIDINSASESDLISVEGIGESLAKKIIEYRAEVGRIERIEELTNIKGIGKKSLAKFSKYLCVDCI